MISAPPARGLAVQSMAPCKLHTDAAAAAGNDFQQKSMSSWQPATALPARLAQTMAPVQPQQRRCKACSKQLVLFLAWRCQQCCAVCAAAALIATQCVQTVLQYLYLQAVGHKPAVVTTCSSKPLTPLEMCLTPYCCAVRTSRMCY